MTWKRRGARKGAGRLPERQRQRILAKCAQCYFSFPGICTWPDGPKQIHHIVEAEDGGSDKPENLTACCKSCHVHHSARASVRRRDNWKRRPEKHPGIIE